MKEMPIDVQQVGVVAYPSNDMLVPDLVQHCTTALPIHGSSSPRPRTTDIVGRKPAALDPAAFSLGSLENQITTVTIRQLCAPLEATTQLPLLTRSHTISDHLVSIRRTLLDRRAFREPRAWF